MEDSSTHGRNAGSVGCVLPKKTGNPQPAFPTELLVITSVPCLTGEAVQTFLKTQTDGLIGVLAGGVGTLKTDVGVLDTDSQALNADVGASRSGFDGLSFQNQISQRLML